MLYLYDINHNKSYFVCLHVCYKVAMDWSFMLRLSFDGDICASVSRDAAVAPTFPIAVGKPPFTAPPSTVAPSLSLSFRLSVPLPRTLSPRQLGRPGLQERVSL